MTLATIPRRPAGRKPAKTGNRPNPRSLTPQDSTADLKVVDARTAAGGIAAHIADMRVATAVGAGATARAEPAVPGAPSPRVLAARSRIYSLAVPVNPAIRRPHAAAATTGEGAYDDDFEGPETGGASTAAAPDEMAD